MSKNYCNKSALLVLLLGLFILGLGVQVCFASANPGDASVTHDTGGSMDPPAPPPPPDPNPDTPPNQIDASISSGEVELATREAHKATLDEEQKLTAEKEKKSEKNISLKSGKDLVKPPTTLELIESKQEIKP